MLAISSPMLFFDGGIICKSTLPFCSWKTWADNNKSQMGISFCCLAGSIRGLSADLCFCHPNFQLETSRYRWHVPTETRKYGEMLYRVTFPSWLAVANLLPIVWAPCTACTQEIAFTAICDSNRHLEPVCAVKTLLVWTSNQTVGIINPCERLRINQETFVPLRMHRSWSRCGEKSTRQSGPLRSGLSFPSASYYTGPTCQTPVGWTFIITGTYLAVRPLIGKTSFFNRFRFGEGW